MALRLTSLLVVVLLCFVPSLFPRRLVSGADPDHRTTHVASLPGFDGDLPFHLETGYVTVDEESGAELFYYFIESEGDPGADPVLLWLTGGDRCSVLSAIFYEIGPVKLVVEPYDGSTPRLRYHPYSWTKAASILFVDSPVGAGFSFSRDPSGYDVGEVSTSLQLVKFVYKWFGDHPEYLANSFYVGGDSSAGKLIPFIVHKISEDIEAGMEPNLSLKGYLLGNPGTGELQFDVGSRVPYAHGMGIISDQSYETITRDCQGDEYYNPKNLICSQQMNRFYDLLNEISTEHVLYKKCIEVFPGPDDNTHNRIMLEGTAELEHLAAAPPLDCITYGYYLSYYWVNRDITWEALGIKKGSIKRWVRCHQRDLPYSEDMGSTIEYHRNLTSKGYRALIYSGDHDSLIPFVGTQSWVRSLNFPILDDWRSWHIEGQSAGFTITYSNNMTFATVKGGGHTAPEYQPERCYAMFRRWISNEPL
ncbi:serine carboxypeptidase-like 7 [Oryza brachyantha]|uniref:Serine carboxypeptidase-like 19 n=1 Tax=Oryza brachyantha TaxID=4533 RepID=J3N7Y3_ORYBR|nr:serine carboxypeptidase-like 7 [Oryza brachyantha]